MIQRKATESGSIHIIFVIFGIVALVGAMGFILWNNFLNKDGVTSQPSASGAQPVVHKPCEDSEDEHASAGVFCSEEIGIKFPVPVVFKEKVEKLPNYEVYKGPIDPRSKESAGMTENVFMAKLSGNDNLSLVIAQEPLRSGYIDVAHLLRPVYFDASTGSLNNVNSPESHYDAASDTTTKTGGYSLGDPVPSVDVNGVILFKATSGDAGRRKAAYIGVIKGKLVKIQLEHQAYMGDPAHDPGTLEPNSLFDEFDKNIEKLKLI